MTYKQCQRAFGWYSNIGFFPLEVCCFFSATEIFMARRNDDDNTESDLANVKIEFRSFASKKKKK